MSQNDPFSHYLDDDKTVLKPSPRRRSQSTENRFENESQQANNDATITRLDSSFIGTQQLKLNGAENNLVGCALPLLSLVTQIRNTVTHTAVSELRNSVIDEIKTFDIKARQLGCPAEQVQTARYALCSLLDEMVLNTPWGCNSIWSTQGMLVSFHKEAWGGEKFFQVLNNIIPQPGLYIDLLELFYYCISLGFEGRYKVQDLGKNQLYEVRENLYQVIERYKGEYEQDLSIHWQGITDQRNTLARYMPLWVISAVAAGVLTTVFISLFFLINQQSGSAIDQQYQIKDALNVKPEPIKKHVLVKPKAVFQPPITPVIDKVRLFLAAEIALSQVEVVTENGLSIIRIKAKSFFASGRDKIQKKFLPLMEKISTALELVKKPIIVVGHTDNIPIFTVRFPSNWVLSQARAQVVADILRNNAKHKDNVTAEGRADTQSLVLNDSAQHRAMNRRVEITF